jgi:Domain of unknown function (DUF4382)
MQRWFSSREANGASRPYLLPTLFFCLSFFGCGNSCFVFVSNPGGTLPPTIPSCQLGTATGTVSLQITAAPAPSTGESPARIQHIFVTLRGIEATASAIPDDNAADWRELAPKLATQPVQLDLLARSSEACERSAFGDVIVPADAYRRLRLQLAPNQPAQDESVPEENKCGGAGFNCVVTFDGEIRPLVLDSQPSQMQVGSDHISGGFFRVLPDTAANLKIEFNPHSSVVFSTNDAVRLVPAFTVEAQSPCESAALPNE